MKKTAEVVIIGGGIVGLSIAYHLAKRGMTDVIVLEKEDMVGLGSTARCSGGFRHQFSTNVNVQMSLLSVGKLREFPDEMDQEIAFHQDGYLFLLDGEQYVEPFMGNIDFQRGLDIPVELLKPEEVGRVLPGVDLKLDDIEAAVYCGIDGVSDPAGVTEGFRKNAARLGVSICTEQEVVGIDVENGRVSGVRTRNGRLSTPLVVNGAGPYAARIGSMAGVDIPVEPIRHFVWVTKPFDGAPSRHTLVVEFSSGWCFHREGNGILMAMGDRAAPPTFEVGVDWDFFETVMETAVNRYPALENSAIAKSWAGAYETTPDHNPILGRVPGLDGLVLANGFSGHGFMHSPATGQLVAEVILDGEATSIDISSLSLDRFSKGELIQEHHVI
jgi:sarcosine oxidase subunit beta